MVSVAEATEVSVSTLHRWARESGWRSEDLAGMDGPHPGESRDLDVEHTSTLTPDPGADMPLPSLADAAERAGEMAIAALMAGNFPRAETALRLALRFNQLAPRPPSDTSEPEDSGPDPRIELLARYNRLAAAREAAERDGAIATP